MSQERVMLLIDADNLSVDVMEQAVRLLLNQHGGVHVRRAYCTAESAVANQTAFKRLGIKPMVNLAAGKNSTDIAMAVDAIDLVLSERPDVVVIASSDSDFAPLVQRLREKGCVVRGVGQKGKVGDETQDVYDDYTVFEHRGGAAPRVAAAKAARAPRASRARATPAVADAPVAKTSTARKTTGRRSTQLPTQVDADAVMDLKLPQAASSAVPHAEKTPDATIKPAAKVRRTRAPKADTKANTAAAESKGFETVADRVVAAAAESTPAPALALPRRRGRKPAAAPDSDAPVVPQVEPAAAPKKDAGAAEPASQSTSPRATLQAVLACLPELTRGQSLALNVAVQRLREARLLGKNSSSLKLFSQLNDSLELLPARNPSQVKLRA